MNKSELVEALAAHYDGSRADATRALNAFVNTVSSATAAGERVAITGFGVFERVERPARTVRNPRTGERLSVPATAVPRFRPGTELKAYVSGERAVPALAAGTTPGRTSAPAAGPVAAQASAPTEPSEAATKRDDKPAITKAKATIDKVKPKGKAKDKAKGKPKAKDDKKSKGKKK
jgi:DNA-binding protein HU-beta